VTEINCLRANTTEMQPLHAYARPEWVNDIPPGAYRPRSNSDGSISTIDLPDALMDRPPPSSDDESVTSSVEPSAARLGVREEVQESVVFRFPFAQHKEANEAQAADPLPRMSLKKEANEFKKDNVEFDKHATSAVDAARKNQSGLCHMHACVHCHASKTACTDVRPCPRCCRLGLDCSSERDQPRKRACKGCHAGKVACDFGESDTCHRCARLGIPCVPRSDQTPAGASRKRRRNTTPVILIDDPDGSMTSLGPARLVMAAPAPSQMMSVVPAPAMIMQSFGSPMLGIAASLLQLSKGSDAGTHGVQTAWPVHATPLQPPQEQSNRGEPAPTMAFSWGMAH